MRLFIAILFGDDIIKSLQEVQERLRDAGIEGRFMPEENLHMTLAFIGDYSDPDDVLDVMDEIPFKTFCINTDRVYPFRDMYMMSFAESDDLSTYVRRLRRALAQADIPYDRKKFVPHVTLVRKASSKVNDLIIPDISEPVTIQVRGISLMRSEFGKNGMIYTEIGYVDGNESED